MSISSKILLKTTNPLRFQYRYQNSLVKTITVRPSLRPYGELQVISPGKFKNPKKPFDMSVKYADSSLGEKRKQTVLAIHGCPGNYQHFERMVNDFHQSNDDVRFIAISMPDFTHTRKTRFYSNTTPENVNFIRQFLYDLKVDTVDCLACHSHGAHTAVALCDNPEDLNIGSLCMYAPQPHWKSEDFIKDLYRFKKLLTFKNRFWYSLLDLVKVHKFINSPLLLKNNNEFLSLVSILNDDMRFGFRNRLGRVFQETDIPISIIYGTEEKFLSKENILKFNSIVGIEEDLIVKLDPKVHRGKALIENDKRINSYLLQDGGHLLHIKYHEIAKQILMNLLEKVDSSKRIKKNMS